ncbi:alkaline phosphatase D family protein [Streptomonospora arabica]|uniref:Alkaline phosphatase D family protein n=1 Tax=Streptomonospora arabica TaxID=412417 RepID=A0ABV9SQI9_9ACTN
MGNGLRLGPLLRHVTETTATIWVETEAPCEVAVTAGGYTARSGTFTVHGHHYALCDLRGLPPGAALPYEVRLDGETAWPQQGAGRPPSVVHTLDAAAPARVLFGSCHTPTEHSRASVLRYGVDMLRAYALRLAAARSGAPRADGSAQSGSGAGAAAALPEGGENEPSLLLLIGDQVYADELQPGMTDYLARRRAHARARGQGAAGSRPPDEVVSFDEYAELYRQSWSDPDIRWLLSTVPTLMLFDDHDIRDDWNTSGTWRRQMEQNPWWRPRITAGLGAYWIYQHLGNLAPDERAADPVFAEVLRASASAGPASGPSPAAAEAGRAPAGTAAHGAAADADAEGTGALRREAPASGGGPAQPAGAPFPAAEGDAPAAADAPGPAEKAAAGTSDAAPVVDAFAWRSHQEADSYRWSFRFDIGRDRLLMVDTRCGRVVDDDTRRSMLDPVGAAWLDEQLTGDVDHLVVASTLPFLLPAGVHHLESWNEAVCAGAWGQAMRRPAEKVRQEIDLEHWAAFQSSFRSVADTVLRVAAGERGAPPASVLFLGGDVHFSYLARARAAGAAADPAGGGTRIAQLVCSPTCNRMPAALREMTWLSVRGIVAAIGSLMARAAGVPRSPLHWRIEGGPWYDNSLAALVLDGRSAEVVWSHSPVARRTVKRLTPNESPRPDVRELAHHVLTP